MKTKLFWMLVLSMGLVLNGCGKSKTEVNAVDGTQSNQTQTEKTSAHKAWYSFEEGIQKSADENKHIVIDFYTDWCKWCKVMDEKTFSVPEVEAYLFENFVPIRIDAESDEEVTFNGQTYTYRQLTSAFGVTGFPSLAYLTSTKEMITVIPGYIEKDKFMDILMYIAKECYAKEIPFDTFKENEDCL